MIKIPPMSKEEYDDLIKQNFIGRIAFKGTEYPYITPFMYIFDGTFLYFLSTKYGKKIKEIKQDPRVAVEIEKYTEDMSSYKFANLQGRIIEVDDDLNKKKIKEMFVKMIKDRNLSNKALAAIGHSPEEPIQLILEEDRTVVWKLVDLKQIVALKNP
jgi:Predicted flavin-nucleotide-binding protein